MMRALVLLMAVVLAACSGTATETTATVGSEATTTAPAESTTTTVATTTTGAPEATTTDVAFPAGDLDLVGTLRMPADDHAPAVIFMHGSGPNSRDMPLPGQLNMGFGFTIPVLVELAEALQEEGFAVLTYDKRSCGSFNGCSDNGYPLPADDITIDTFIDDARAAVEFVRTQPGVDASAVSVVGISQGSEFVPVMLESDPDLLKGAMLGGPFGPIDELIAFQLDSSVELLSELGVSQEDALATPGVVSLAEMVDGLAGIRDGGDEPVGGVSAVFWNSWFDLHDQRLEAATMIEQPLLVFNGAYDWNVPPTEAEAWAAHLEAAGAGYELVILDCVTHALNCVSQPDPTAITTADIGQHVHAGVIEALIEFLR